MKADAILFDFDGVILDTEWSIYESMRETFIENGHDLPLEEYVKCIGSDFNTWSPENMLEELTGKTFDWKPLALPVTSGSVRKSVSSTPCPVSAKP